MVFIFNLSYRQSNSPPPIRRQPTWSRSSLVRTLLSLSWWSGCWDKGSIMDLKGEDQGCRDQGRIARSIEGHDSLAGGVANIHHVPLTHERIPLCGLRFFPVLLQARTIIYLQTIDHLLVCSGNVPQSPRNSLPHIEPSKLARKCFLNEPQPNESS